MKARFPGTCPLCTEDIYEGQEIRMVDVNGDRKAVHEVCERQSRDIFRKAPKRLEDRW